MASDDVVASHHHVGIIFWGHRKSSHNDGRNQCPPTELWRTFQSGSSGSCCYRLLGPGFSRTVADGSSREPSLDSTDMCATEFAILSCTQKDVGESTPSLCRDDK